MKNTNESGRSMVEMLGVLAIIGVLSVGGIAGYTRAMRNWRANEIIDAANKAVVIAETEDGANASVSYADIADISKVAGGYVDSIIADRTGSSGKVTITLSKNTTAFTQLKDAIEEKLPEKNNKKVIGMYEADVKVKGAAQ
jgi:type II secretory pathway pseudopilin PulG